MADGYSELVAEIDRIINSPYPTLLKVHDTINTPLHNIVTLTRSHRLSTILQGNAPRQMSAGGLVEDHARLTGSRSVCSMACVRRLTYST